MTDLSRYGSCTLDQDGCTTCGDVGIPVRIVRLVDATRAECEDRDGRRAEIATDFVPEAEAGDILMVHMGVAIAQLEAVHTYAG